MAAVSASHSKTLKMSPTPPVQAESVYEAVAMAIAEFREGPWMSAPGPMTEFTIALDRAGGRAPHQAQSGREMGAGDDKGRTRGERETAEGESTAGTDLEAQFSGRGRLALAL